MASQEQVQAALQTIDPEVRQELSEYLSSLKYKFGIAKRADGSVIFSATESAIIVEWLSKFTEG